MSIHPPDGERTVPLRPAAAPHATTGPGVRRPDIPAQMTRHAEIRAASPKEFAKLLRLLADRAGLSVPRIAQRAGIPRSQAYAMVARDRTTLPRRYEQVSAFAAACGLPADRVELVVRVWVRLNETRAGTAAPATDAGPDADGATPEPVTVIPARPWLAITAAAIVGLISAVLIMMLPSVSREPAMIALVGIAVALVIIALCAVPWPLRRRDRPAPPQQPCPPGEPEPTTMVGFIDDDIQ